MSRVVWTPAAEQDLEGIFLYVGRERHSPRAAAELVREIAAKAATYAEQPMLAEVRLEFGPAVRVFAVGPYVVFYRPAAVGIEVLRVIHGAREFARVFRQQEP